MRILKNLPLSKLKRVNKQVGGSEKKILLDQSVKTFYILPVLSKFIDEKRKEPCYMIERIKLELERHKFDRVLISRARDEIYRLIYIYIRDRRHFDPTVYDTFDTCYPFPRFDERGHRRGRERESMVLKLESLNFMAYLAYLRGQGFFIVAPILLLGEDTSRPREIPLGVCGNAGDAPRLRERDRKGEGENEGRETEKEREDILQRSQKQRERLLHPWLELFI